MATSSIIITKDEDFAQRRILVKNGPTIVWLRLGNSRTKTLIDWFDAAFQRVIVAIEHGETIIEVT